MAVRKEELQGYGHRPTDQGAEVLAFPTALVRARARRQRHQAMIRRRIVTITALIVIAGAWLSAGGAAHPAPSSIAGAPRAVTIHRGQSLWDIAERFAPASVDPRAYVDAVMELNGLSGAPAIGARLQLPR